MTMYQIYSGYQATKVSSKFYETLTVKTRKLTLGNRTTAGVV